MNKTFLILISTISATLLSVAIGTPNWTSGSAEILGVSSKVNWGLWNYCQHYKLGILQVNKCNNVAKSLPSSVHGSIKTCQALAIAALALNVIAACFVFLFPHKVWIVASYLLAAGCALAALLIWSKNLFNVASYKLGGGYSFTLLIFAACVSALGALVTLIL